MPTDHHHPDPSRSRRRRHYGVTALFGLTMLAGQCAPAKCAPQPPAPAPAPAPAALREIIDRTNAERAAVGLPALSVDQRLMNAAQAHSADQAARETMSHTGGDGSKPAQRVERAGYDWRSVAENVAMGYPDAASVMEGWMDSPGHRDNILRSSVTQIGVGLAYSPSGAPYWTQVFAAAR